MGVKQNQKLHHNCLNRRGLTPPHGTAPGPIPTSCRTATRLPSATPGPFALRVPIQEVHFRPLPRADLVAGAVCHTQWQRTLRHLPGTSREPHRGTSDCRSEVLRWGLGEAI